MNKADLGWPKWAAILRNWLVVVTGLLAAITAFLFAIGKAGDAYQSAYEAACKALPICAKPKFQWVATDVPVSISQTIAKDTPFVFPDLSGAPPQGPEVGNQRYGDPVATCGPIQQNAWKLHNGTIVLDCDPRMMNGWTSPSWVGEPEPPDWNRFDGMARAMFGWTPGFANNRCSKGQRCTVSPDEIRARSKPVTTPVEDCSRMRMVEKNFSISRSSLTVWIRGKAYHDSLWTVTVPVQTYKSQH